MCFREEQEKTSKILQGYLNILRTRIKKLEKSHLPNGHWCHLSMEESCIKRQACGLNCDSMCVQTGPSVVIVNAFS